MKRLKSIDIFRGMGMVYIMVGHMIDWWTISSEDWLFNVYVSLFSAIGAAGFVFISGVSTMISYRNRIEKVKNTVNYGTKIMRREYFIRGLLILGLGLLYNGIVAIEVAAINAMSVFQSACKLSGLLINRNIARGTV